MTHHARLLLLSDFNLDLLKGFLNHDNSSPAVAAETTDFGQIMPVLLNPTHTAWEPRPSAVVVWTRPEGVIESFRDLTEYRPVDTDEVMTQVDNFAAALRAAAANTGILLVPTWTAPTHHRGMGILDMRQGVGMTHTLMQMNLRLAEQLADVNNCFLLNSAKWIETVGKNAFNRKMWYLGKMPFDPAVLKEAGRDIKGALTAARGESRRLVVLDLDDTLWGGIVGDAGWENLRLGGHDPIGESFVDFQKALKALQNRGIILAVVSKNTEAVALEAIDKHPEMVLRRKDFAAWKINWEDKARNIVELTQELNLGLQSVIFIDDNPIERGRVAEALPEVFVPEWPKDKLLYTQTLLGLGCFDNVSRNEEDFRRQEMYLQEKERKNAMTGMASMEAWLQSLDIKVTVEPLQDSNIQRVTQLLNKTNQMNLTTRRMTDVELAQWAATSSRRLWVFRVEDRFGDAGLTGIASLEHEGRSGRIVDFILSCRVFGRCIEEAMVTTLLNYARNLDLEAVEAQYQPTAKNAPCLDFFNDRSGFKRERNSDRFTWQVQASYPPPDYVTIVDTTRTGAAGSAEPDDMFSRTSRFEGEVHV